MKLKNILLSGLSLVLVAALAIGGTVAYLQDDDSDVNVMTLGNVKIEQHEYERVVNSDGTYKTETIDNVTSYVLKDFTQGKPLLPATEIDANGNPYNFGAGNWDNTVVRMTQVGSYGGMQVFTSKNAQDKFVTVENTGKTDAYIRTIVAIEVGDASASLIGTSYHQTWTKDEVGTIVVDGNTYFVSEYVYNGANGTRHDNGILPAGDTAYPNLSQVYISAAATNEDMVKLDGNGNGTLDILVISQAVQAAGFDNAQTALDTAFGKSSEKAAEWFGGTVIPVYGEGTEALDYVLDNGGKLFVEENISTEQITVAENTSVEVDLQGNTLSGIVENNGTMNVSDGKLEGTYIQNNGNATFTNVEMAAGDASNYGAINKAGATTEYNNVNIVSAGGGIGVTGGAKVVFNSGSVYVDSSSTSGRYVIYTDGAGSEIVINDGTFSWNTAKNNKRAYIYAAADTTVIVNGGNFGPASTRSGYTTGILGEGTVIIKGGTFGFDPSAWVAEGYEAVKDGSTWTVSAK